MAASNFDPLVDRLYEILVDGFGTNNALTSSQVFGATIYPGQDDTQRATSARETDNGKAVWVSIPSAQPSDGTGPANRGRYLVTVEIVCAYSVEAEGEHATKWRTIIKEAQNDAHRIRSILRDPLNVEQTSLSVATGVSGLVYQQTLTDGPDPSTRLLQSTHTYQTWVSVDVVTSNIVPTSATKLSSQLDLYVDDASGDDDNPGTSSNPLATITAAEALIPDVVSAPVIIHVAPHTGSGYELPDFRPRIYQDNIDLIGDGASQGGDGFTELVSTTADSGSDSTKVVTSGLTTNEHRGKTVIITSGAADGDRRTIRNNTTTDIVPCEHFTSAVASGDSFRVVEPAIECVLGDDSVLLHGGPTTGAGFSMADSEPSPALRLTNLRVAGSSITTLNIKGGVVLSGVEVAPFLRLSGSRYDGSVILGETHPGANATGSTFSAPSENSWLGWGLFTEDTLQLLHVRSGGRGLVSSQVFSFGSSGDFNGGNVYSGGLTASSGSQNGPNHLRFRGKTSGADIPFLISGQVSTGSLSELSMSVCTIDVTGEDAVVADRAGIVQLLQCTITTDQDGLVARNNGRIFIFDLNDFSITSTGVDTRVVDVEGSDETRALANYTARGSYISAGDGSLIQRETD